MSMIATGMHDEGESKPPNVFDLHGNDLLKATATPALFAQAVSGGRWTMAKHLVYLDRVICDAFAGRGPRQIIVSMPPRHGKSELCSKYLPAWFLGAEPDKRVILASYGADFAQKWGRKARDLLTEYGPHVFGVKVSAASSAANRWDVDGRDGGMDTAGADGPLTGKGAHLLIVDDPIKDYAEALSATQRDSVWDWWESTAFTRLQVGGVALVIQTRWHEDDLAGRLMARYPGDWLEVKMPAIAEANDVLGRGVGDALWPEQWPLAELDKKRRGMREFWWSALYQQRPAPEQGGMFKRDNFQLVSYYSRAGVNAVRYWDKAATADGGDYSVGVLMTEASGIYTVADVVRGQWSSAQRNAQMLATAAKDRQEFGGRCQTWIEVEPGAGGKESGELSVKLLSGYSVRAETVRKDKVVRADEYAAQVEGCNVRVLDNQLWTNAFLDEHAMFPNGANDDQVDAASGAFNKLAAMRMTGGVPEPTSVATEARVAPGQRISRVNAAEAVRFGGAARRMGR